MFPLTALLCISYACFACLFWCWSWLQSANVECILFIWAQVTQWELTKNNKQNANEGLIIGKCLLAMMMLVIRALMLRLSSLDAGNPDADLSIILLFLCCIQQERIIWRHWTGTITVPIIPNTQNIIIMPKVTVNVNSSNHIKQRR